MSNYIKKTREGDGYNTDVRAPLRRVNIDSPIEDITRAPITNLESMFKSDSILSKLDSRSKNFSIVEGVTCWMVAKIDESIFKDKVTIRGERGNYYIVEIDGTLYSVYKTIVTFVIE